MKEITHIKIGRVVEQVLNAIVFLSIFVVLGFVATMGMYLAIEVILLIKSLF